MAYRRQSREILPSAWRRKSSEEKTKQTGRSNRVKAWKERLAAENMTAEGEKRRQRMQEGVGKWSVKAIRHQWWRQTVHYGRYQYEETIGVGRWRLVQYAWKTGRRRNERRSNANRCILRRKRGVKDTPDPHVRENVWRRYQKLLQCNASVANGRMINAGRHACGVLSFCRLIVKWIYGWNEGEVTWSHSDLCHL